MLGPALFSAGLILFVLLMIAVIWLATR